MEVEGIIPAPYMARNHWVAMIELNALRQPEVKELIRSSYQLVLKKLPKKTQAFAPKLSQRSLPPGLRKLNRCGLRNAGSNLLHG